MQYYQVLISSETTAQGLRILDHLMAKQLVLGGPVFSGPSKFLWNFKASAVPKGMQKDGLYIDEHDYCFAITYTREDLIDQTPRRHVRGSRNCDFSAPAHRRSRRPDLRAEQRNSVADKTIVLAR